MAANGRGRHASDARDRGFTLVEIVIAIVLTGVLAAVVVVGVGRLVEQGSAAGCAASADAARAAVLVHRTMTGSAPTSFSDLLGSGALEGSEGVTTAAGGLALAGSDWTLVWYGNGEGPPRLECSTVDLGTPGLTAEVFNSSNFTNPIQTMTHTTGTSANWGYGSPLPGMGEAFSVRYTGTLTIPTSGTWTFTSTADNAVTIWINDQRLLTNNATATAAIAAGTYPLRIDFTEVSHAASWNLTWTPPGTTTPTTIPATALTTATIPTVTTTPPAPLLALDTTTATTASFRITPTPTHPKVLGNTATTLTCTAPGQPTRTSTTPTWLIGVDQLTTGTTYTCTATLDGSPPSPPVTVTTTPTPTTPGLTATIYSSSNFTNPIQTVTHTGPTSANWGYGSPLPGMGEAFSVRYTGTVTIPTSGTWTFTSTADNAVTIWINDQRLLTNSATATAVIAAGTYPLRIDFIEVSHAASWTLTWTAPGSSTATTVPATALTTAAIPTVTTTPPAPLLALDTTTATTASLRITPTPTHPKILGNTATTLTCTAPGQPTRTSTTPTWLIGVDQLATGTTYTCTATLDGSPPSAPVTVTPTATPTTAGLTATIHHSTNFANPIQTMTHTTGTSANWGYGTPLPGMGDTFSVRYTGTLTIPTSGTWTFTSTADNAVTIWINDQRLLTNNATAAAAIAAGTYPIRIDFTEVGHAASWNLTWTPPGTNTPTTIPATALTTA